MAKQALPDAFVDESLEKVLRASGSSFSHYTLPGNRERLRQAMREVIASAREIA